ncbi:hypothetical protein EMCG_02907 [[Emmonsia] crescens]|uniref:Uncharacterized protein n=1 Tax=[Emmonsia] crescens TaxID=73230 RepID=A0A0G2HX72_9EURO|nr:hypothetical protein EMCG_02907 [Emmonsia crescens UAMH 3008]
MEAIGNEAMTKDPIASILVSWQGHTANLSLASFPQLLWEWSLGKRPFILIGRAETICPAFFAPTVAK